MSHTIKKRRIDFYGHILRMDPERITKRIFDFFRNKKTKLNWFKETEKDLREFKITEEMLAVRSAKSIIGGQMKRFQDKIGKDEEILGGQENTTHGTLIDLSFPKVGETKKKKKIKSSEAEENKR